MIRVEKKIINNPKERKRVYVFIGIAVVLLMAAAVALPVIFRFIKPHTDAFKEMHEYVGSAARVGFFFSISLYPIYLLLKYKKLMDLEAWGIRMKQIFRLLAKWARQWHVPVGILATGIITIHVALAIVNGFKLTGAYISGITAYVMLLVLVLLGILRYQRKDQDLHLYLGLLFVAAFIIHTLFNA